MPNKGALGTLYSCLNREQVTFPTDPVLIWAFFVRVMSESTSLGRSLNKRLSGAGNITHPFVTKYYTFPFFSCL